MKSAVFYEKGNIRIENIAVPDVRPDEVLVKVMACGICGTDVHIFDGDEGAAATPPGTVLGHEFSGIVVETGESTDGISVGDRVCIDPNLPCGKCYYCRKGLNHFCENIVGIGTTVNGGFSQYCAVPQSQIYKIADTTSFEEAAMAEPVSCCLHGIDLCNIQTDDTVAVIGCGMIGLIMIQLAKTAGAAKVIAIEPEKAKRELAQNLGASLCIDPNDKDAEKMLYENFSITKVIECVGKIETMEQAVHLAGKKATVMFFGLCAPNDILNIKPFEIFKKELTIKSSYINPYTQQRAVEMIDSKRIDVKSMIYSVEKLEALPQILSDRNLRRKGKFIIGGNAE